LNYIHDIQRNYRFLVILDGLDEMSLGMHDTAVLENLGRLEELIEQFNGHKLIITSRKMAIYADKIRERIMDCLHRPEVLHLAPITQKDCLAYLKKFTETPQRKERLLKMQNTHDLLGLAAKPAEQRLYVPGACPDKCITSAGRVGALPSNRRHG